MKKAKRKNEPILFGSMRKKQRRIVALIIAIFFAIMSVLPIAGTFAQITIPKSCNTPRVILGVIFGTLHSTICIW